MLIVWNVELIKTTRDLFRISWDARGPSGVTPQESVDDYNFKLLWSYDPVNDYHFVLNKNGNEVVIDGAIGPLDYTDPKKHTPHDRKVYYKVRQINKINPSLFKDSQFIYIGDRFDGVHETIRYAEDVLYSQYIGEPVYFAKSKTDGARCPECWNPLQYRRMKTHCNTCHGTGFYDGFFTPIEIQCSFDANPKISEVSMTGEKQMKTVSARISNFPLANPRDMIINKDDSRRYLITKVDITKLPNRAATRGLLSGSNYIVSQILTLKELEPDDDKYNVILIGQDLRGQGEALTDDVLVLGEGEPSHVGGGNLTTPPADIEV